MASYFNFNENKFLGALALENFFPKKTRDRIAKMSNFILLVASVPFIYAFFIKIINLLTSSYLLIPLESYPSFLNNYQGFWTGIFYIALAIRLKIMALESFYNSKTHNLRGDAPQANIARRLNFYASELWYRSSLSMQTPGIDEILDSLTKTAIGNTTIVRLGIISEDYKTPGSKFSHAKDIIFSILHGRNAAEAENEQSQTLLKKEGGQDKSFEAILTYLDEKKGENSEITFTDIFSALFDLDKNFHDFLVEKGCTQEILQGAARWVEKEFTLYDENRRWWTRERLARVPGFAKSWAYGRTPLLEKFTSDLGPEARFSGQRLIGREREIGLLESALLKQSGANVIIAGKPGSGKETILLGIVRMINEGKIFSELEHKQIFKLHGPAIIASGKTKGEIEELLLSVLNEAMRAGNIILAIDQFPEFTQSLSSLGVNVTEVFSPYLASTQIHIIALADMLAFRKVLENNSGLMQYFEKIEIEEPGRAELTEILESLAPTMEAHQKHKIIVTYPAIDKISEAAIQYLVTGALPERAVDLMEQVVQRAAAENISYVTPELVLQFVREKTKMPLGEIKKEEQDKLLRLEEFLHKRVVEQNEAITAIANALRRARSGIRNPNRPIGSFLFLGPTGVGKTETAKTLAEIYFGSEDAMIRFDMTEYQSSEDLKRLIGSSQTGDPGILASKIRSSPYSVALLDEFEKSSKEIRNLFLQILDEGFFSDYLGQQVNMRNTIIVATSNAGSELIWELIQQKKDPATLKEQIISHIQKGNIMSPELLNRFDSIVVFHPLNDTGLKQIARLMLQKLALRLEKQNIHINVTEDLVDFVAQGGYNPSLGARPMQRFIQDKIEKIISEKIINGNIKPGSEFSLSPEEIS